MKPYVVENKGVGFHVKVNEEHPRVIALQKAKEKRLEQMTKPELIGMVKNMAILLDIEVT